MASSMAPSGAGADGVVSGIASYPLTQQRPPPHDLDQYIPQPGVRMQCVC
jgi:hypothetical protein